MTARPVNIHATAIVIGTTGLLFVGHSGSGKSKTAFACLEAARQRGLFAALIADDRTLISEFGQQILAEQPPSIAGLIELRGSGIAAVTHIAAGLVHYAVRPVKLDDTQRLPPEGEIFAFPAGTSLPLLRVDVTSAAPLAVLAAFIPDLLVQDASRYR